MGTVVGGLVSEAVEGATVEGAPASTPGYTVDAGSEPAGAAVGGGTALPPPGPVVGTDAAGAGALVVGGGTVDGGGTGSWLVPPAARNDRKAAAAGVSACSAPIGPRNAPSGKARSPR